jgi:hypothetical protein
VTKSNWYSSIDGCDLSAAGAGDSKGRRCGAPWIDTATPQSIFQAEKITLGTAGSPAGFL